MITEKSVEFTNALCSTQYINLYNFSIYCSKIKNIFINGKVATMHLFYKWKYRKLDRLATSKISPDEIHLHISVN